MGRARSEPQGYVAEAEEPFQLRFIALCFQVTNCVGRMVNWLQSFWLYYTPEIVYLFCKIHALPNIQCDDRVESEGQYCGNVRYVFVCSSGKYDEIVELH